MSRTRAASALLGALGIAPLLGFNDGGYHPRIDPAHFVTGVNNPYFPLRVGTTYYYRSETPEGTETEQMEVTDDTQAVMGVTTMIIHDQVFLDGNLTEDTFDWYAQDDRGNVWYFGEDSTQVQNGVPIGHEGSWEAGVNG